MDDRPIGVFDSGFGGLTITRALVDLLPQERLVYFGDSARYPYGSKALHAVAEHAHEIAEWLIRMHDVKLVVVACNTATAAALDSLQDRFDVPIVGVVDAGARSVISISHARSIGVIGTVGTIRSGAYQAAITQLDATIRLTCAACPGFVEFVELGETRSDQVHVLAERLLAPIVDAKVDALLLGCTHYPFLSRTITDVMGKDVVLVSSADETAFQVRAMLADNGDARAGEPVDPLFYSSGEPDDFARIGRRLFGSEMVDVHKWDGG